jgi:hypothetical protein
VDESEIDSANETATFGSPFHIGPSGFAPTIGRIGRAAPVGATSEAASQAMLQGRRFIFWGRSPA